MKRFVLLSLAALLAIPLIPSQADADVIGFFARRRARVANNVIVNRGVVVRGPGVRVNVGRSFVAAPRNNVVFFRQPQFVQRSFVVQQPAFVQQSYAVQQPVFIQRSFAQSSGSYCGF